MKVKRIVARVVAILMIFNFVFGWGWVQPPAVKAAGLTDAEKWNLAGPVETTCTNKPEEPMYYYQDFENPKLRQGGIPCPRNKSASLTGPDAFNANFVTIVPNPVDDWKFILPSGGKLSTWSQVLEKGRRRPNSEAVNWPWYIDRGHWIGWVKEEDRHKYNLIPGKYDYIKAHSGNYCLMLGNYGIPAGSKVEYYKDVDVSKNMTYRNLEASAWYSATQDPRQDNVYFQIELLDGSKKLPSSPKYVQVNGTTGEKVPEYGAGTVLRDKSYNGGKGLGTGLWNKFEVKARLKSDVKYVRYRIVGIVIAPYDVDVAVDDIKLQIGRFTKKYTFTDSEGTQKKCAYAPVGATIPTRPSGMDREYWWDENGKVYVPGEIDNLRVPDGNGPQNFHQVPDVIPDPDGDRNTHPKNQPIPKDFIKVTFDPTERSTDPAKKTYYFVHPTRVAKLAVPEVPVGKLDLQKDVQYVCRGWNLQGLTQTAGSISNRYTEETVYIPDFDEYETVVPVPEGGQTPDVPSDYIRVTYDPKEHGQFTDTTKTHEWMVNPLAGKTLADLESPQPAVTPAYSYQFNRWDKAIDFKITGTKDIKVFASYNRDEIIPEPSQPRPDGYWHVVFDTTQGAFAGEKKQQVFDVLKHKEGHPDQLVTFGKQFPTDPERENYDFAGWTENSNQKPSADPLTADKGVNRDWTLYAMWTPQMTNVTFHGIGGSSEATVEARLFTPLGNRIPSEGTYEGYTFKGWYKSNTDFTEANKIDANYPVAEKNQHFYALWKKNFYELPDPEAPADDPDYVKVTFHANDGQIAGKLKKEYLVLKGTTIPAIPTATRQNHVFDFWTEVKDSGKDAKVSVKDVVTKAKDFYASWTKKDRIVPGKDTAKNDPEYTTVTFLPGTDGSIASGETVYSVLKHDGVTVGDVSKPAVAPKDGYNHHGWDTADSTEVVADPIVVTAQYRKDVIPGTTQPYPDYIKVVVDSTDKATPETRTNETYYVVPDKEVTIPAATEPIGEKNNIFTEWDSAFKRIFTEKVTTITAQYIPRVIDGGDDPDAEKEGYTRVRFDSDVPGEFGENQKHKTYLIKTGSTWKEAHDSGVFTVPDVKVIDPSYKRSEMNGGWNKPVPKTDDVNPIPEEGVTYTATYDKKVYTENPGDEKKYVSIEFDQGEHGTLHVDSTVKKTFTYWVLNSITWADAKANGLSIPDIVADAEYNVKDENGGWNHALQGADETVKSGTYIAQYNDDVIPANPDGSRPGHVPADYVAVTFIPTENATDPTYQTYYVTPRKVVTLKPKNPIGVTAPKVKYFVNWNKPLTGIFTPAGAPHLITALYTDTNLKLTPKDRQPTEDEYKTKVTVPGGLTLIDLKIDKKPDVSKTGDSEATVTVTFSDGSKNTVKIPVRVVEHVIPAEPDGSKTPDTPDNYVKVILRPTDKATDATERIFYVDPEVEVTLDDGPKPVGKENHVFTGWDKPLKAQFTEEETVITAQYEPAVIDAGDDPEAKKDGYVAIRFLTGEQGEFNDGKKTKTYLIREGSDWNKVYGSGIFHEPEVKVTDPTVVRNTGINGGWDVPVPPASDDKVVKTDFTAQYLPKVVDAGGDETAERDGYHKVIFRSGEHGKFTEDQTSKVYLVLDGTPWDDAVASGLKEPAVVTFEKNYARAEENGGWDQVLPLTSKEAVTDSIFTATYHPIVVDRGTDPTDPDDVEPAGIYAKVVFRSGDHGTFQEGTTEKVYWILKGHTWKEAEQLGFAEPPVTDVEKDYSRAKEHGGWDQDMPDPAGEVTDMTLTAKYHPNVIPSPDGNPTPETPQDYVKVTFVPTEKATDPAESFFYVNPEAVVTLHPEQPTGRALNGKDYRYVRWDKALTGQFTEPTVFTAIYTYGNQQLTPLGEQPTPDQYKKKIDVPEGMTIDKITITKKPDVSKTGDSTATVIVTFTDGTKTTVDIPVRVTDHVIPANPDGSRTEDTPEYYVPVTVDPTDKAENPTPVTYYVNPKVPVQIPDPGVPVGKGNNVFKKWSTPLKGTFKTPTVIEGKYRPRLIDLGENPGGSEDGYVTIVFRSGEHGDLANGKKVQAYRVLKGSTWEDVKRVGMKVPGVDPDDGFVYRDPNRIWNHDLPNKDDVLTDSEYTAEYKQIVIGPGTDPNEKKDGYETVIFRSGDHGKFGKETVQVYHIVTGTTWKEATRLGMKVPGVDVDPEWKRVPENGGWDREIPTGKQPIESQTFTVPYRRILFGPSEDIRQPERPGYVRVVFEAGEHGTFDGEKKTLFYDVLDGVTRKEAEKAGMKVPEPIGPAGYQEDGWNKELPKENDVLKASTFTAMRRPIVIDAGDDATAEKDGYVRITFTSGAHGTFANGKKTQTWLVLKGHTWDEAFKYEMEVPEIPTIEKGFSRLHTFGGWNHEILRGDGTVTDVTYEATFAPDVIPSANGERTPEIPENYVRITLDPTDKADEATRSPQYFFVNPDAEVEIPALTPEGGQNGRVRYIFKKWSHALKGRFDQETVIPALYDEHIEPNEAPKSKPMPGTGAGAATSLLWVTVLAAAASLVSYRRKRG